MITLEDLLCPITGQIFNIPVMAEDGVIYEEEAISKWLKIKQESPMTKEPCKQIYYCRLVKKMVDLFLQLNPDHKSLLYRPDIFSYITKEVEIEFLNLYTKEDLVMIDPSGRTPLVLAIENNKNKAAIWLINRLEFDPDYRFKGKSLLMLACIYKLTDVASVLIDRKWFLPVQRDTEGYTALSYACVNGLDSLSKILIEADPLSVGLHNGDGETPLMLACRAGLEDTALALVQSGKSCPERISADRDTALSLACESKLDRVVRDILNTGQSRPNHINDNNETALNIALRQCTKESVELLLNIEDSLTTGWPDYQQYTPLMRVIEKGYLEMAKLILGSPYSRSSAVNENRDTALTLACKKGWEDVCLKILDLNECDPLHENEEADCALVISCRLNMSRLTSRLIDLHMDRFDNGFDLELLSEIRDNLSADQLKQVNQFMKNLGWDTSESDWETDSDFQSSSSE